MPLTRSEPETGRGRRLRSAVAGVLALGCVLAAHGKEPSAKATSQKMQVVVATQPAEGLTELTLPLLNVMADWVAKRWQERSSDFARSQGYKNARVPRPTSGVSLVNRHGEKIGVIRLQVAEAHQMVVIVVIRDGQLTRVTCGLPGSEPIPVTFGPCADQIQKTFGWSLGGP